MAVYLEMEFYSAVKINKLIPHTKECPNIMLTDKLDIKEWILYNFIFKSRRGKIEKKFPAALGLPESSKSNQW